MTLITPLLLYNYSLELVRPKYTHTHTLTRVILAIADVGFAAVENDPKVGLQSQQRCGPRWG